MSFTAFPVLASLLVATNLLNTPIGVQAMSCAAIDDILAWCTLALASSFSKSGNPVNGLYTCLAALVYVLIMTLIIRPALGYCHAWLERCNAVNNRYYLCFIFLLLIASAFTTEVIGIHAFFGSFVMGLIVPKSGGFTDDLAPKMELVVSKYHIRLSLTTYALMTDSMLASQQFD